jgi:hypothetical protein
MGNRREKVQDRRALCHDDWAFESLVERLPRSSAGAPSQARHRHTQCPSIETQPAVQPGDLVDKAASREDRLRAFAKARRFAHARRDSQNRGWRNASFRGFADYMQTSEFEAGLLRLLKLAGQRRSAIMCAEAVPWRCHRSLIADALTVRGVRVEHILSGKRRQVHSINSFACVRGSHITYPLESGGVHPLLIVDSTSVQMLRVY